MKICKVLTINKINVVVLRCRQFISSEKGQQGEVYNKFVTEETKFLCDIVYVKSSWSAKLVVASC